MPHLDVYKGGEIVETIALSASKRRYTVGRQEGVADILLTHASISREQATLTVSASGSVVVTDLGSAQGTYISGKPIEPRKPHLLAAGRSLVFGKSTRVFKLRDDDGGDGGAAAAVSAAAEPMTEALLRLLRGEAVRGERAPPRLRPDGFTLLAPLASCTTLGLRSSRGPSRSSHLSWDRRPSCSGLIEQQRPEPLVPQNSLSHARKRSFSGALGATAEGLLALAGAAARQPLLELRAGEGGARLAATVFVVERGVFLARRGRRAARARARRPRLDLPRRSDARARAGEMTRDDAR